MKNRARDAGFSDDPTIIHWIGARRAARNQQERDHAERCFSERLQRLADVQSSAKRDEERASALETERAMGRHIARPAAPNPLLATIAASGDNALRLNGFGR
jgi:hypothetical protein